MEISPVKITRAPPSGPAKKVNSSAKVGLSRANPPTGPSNKRKADSLALTPAPSPGPSLISRLNLNEPAGSDNDSSEPMRDSKKPRNDSLLRRLSDNPNSTMKSNTNTTPPLLHPLPPRPVSSAPSEPKSTKTQMHNESAAAEPTSTGLRMTVAADVASHS